MCMWNYDLYKLIRRANVYAAINALANLIIIDKNNYSCATDQKSPKSRGEEIIVKPDQTYWLACG